MKITREIPLTQLKEWDAPHASDTEVETTRDGCVFRAPDDGLTYWFGFSPVYAQYNDMDWYDDMPATVECVRVEQRTVTEVETKWLPVDPDAPADPVLPAAAYETGELAHLARNFALVRWMVHVRATQETFLHRDAAARKPLNETDAHALAAELNQLSLNLIKLGIHPYKRPLRATVFHYGRPHHIDRTEDGE